MTFISSAYEDEFDDSASGDDVEELIAELDESSVWVGRQISFDEAVDRWGLEFMESRGWSFGVELFVEDEHYIRTRKVSGDDLSDWVVRLTPTGLALKETVKDAEVTS